MRGNFKIDGEWYKAAGGLPNQQLANQMASKVGQGTSEYGDLTSWSAWIQENWQDGVGRLRPHRQGGFLYGEADSRVPEQLILPGLLRQVDTRDITEALVDCRYMPVNMTGQFDVYANPTSVQIGEIANVFTTPGTVTGSTFKVWAYLYAPVGTVLTFRIRNNNAGVPGSTVVASSTVTTLEDIRQFAWHGVSLPYSGTLSTGTSYWLTVEGSNDIQVGHGNNNLDAYPNVSYGLINGTWTSQGDNRMAFTTSIHRMAGTTATNTGTGFFRFNDDLGVSSLYHYMRGHIYRYDDTNDQWDSVVNSALTNINSAVVFYSIANGTGIVWLGTEAADSDGAQLLADETVGDPGLIVVSENPLYGVTLYAKHGGLLWKTNANHPGYSDDDFLTETAHPEMKVGSIEYPITGMCGMGDSMYCSTAEGLYRIAPGDFAVGVCPWDSPQEDNGRAMVNHQGALYITANNRVVRLTEDHQMQDVWLTREDDLAGGRIGKVHDLCVWDKWLLALCAGSADGSKPTIWAMQNNAWHHIATLPASTPLASDTLRNYSLYYDRITNNIWCATPDQVTYRIETPEFATNPYNDSAYRYAPRAWVEWDWFDSPIMEAQKDYESVTIIGENISATCPVYVYWKDDASTDWELLGFADSNIEELIWTNLATRPNTRRFKLGILLLTSDGDQTPRIRAIRVKYHLMVRDWFRWSVAVDVSGRTGHTQMMLDDEVNTLTASQIKANLDAVAASVPPVVYQDVDGTDYLVKVNDANFTYTKQVNENGVSYWEGVYRLVFEQVRPGTYTL